MSANSQAPAITISVARNDVQSNWWAWLQSMATAINQLGVWCNRPQLAQLTAATLPTDAVAGTLAFVTDSTVTVGTVAGGGSTPVLVWFNGTDWTVIGV
jgi:hypothetical protein